MEQYSVPQKKSIATRVVLEVVCLLILIFPVAYIYLFVKGNVVPYKRGFYCDDESLKKPNLPEEIPDSLATLYWILIALVLIPLIEVLHSLVFKNNQEKVCKIPWVLVELYRICGYAILGGLSTLLTTELAKFKVGRHRPYFLTLCNIKLNDELCIEDGYQKFVTDYECKASPSEVAEANKSFLSGHSSYSFYCATFLIFYLYGRTKNVRLYRKSNWAWGCLRVIKILRPLLQFLLFAFAFYVSLTRISDYKHHPFDVAIGILVGTVFGTIMAHYLNLTNRPRAFKTGAEIDVEIQECGDTLVVGNLERSPHTECEEIEYNNRHHN